MGACASQCQEVLLDEACKPEADALPVQIDLWDYCAITRLPNTAYAQGDVVYLDPPNGFGIEAQNAGVTGEEPPVFVPALGKLARDGSITWKLVDVNLAEGYNPASSEDASVDPEESGGLEVAGLDLAQGRYLRAQYVGGVAGQRYKVTYSFSVDGVERALVQWVNVT
jgi:hypothetical protein